MNTEKKFLFLHKFTSFKEENDKRMTNLEDKTNSDYKHLMFWIMLSITLGVIGIFT